jgi:hypothetical protein
MRFWKSLWFFIKDTFQSRDASVRQSTTLSRAIRDASHVRGKGLTTPSEEVLEQASEGHEHYNRSFEKNRDKPR